jgi:glycine cleavage system H protein
MAHSAEKYGTTPSLTVLQDGGELCDNILSEMPKEIWQDFQQEFMGSPEGVNRPSEN